jgi:PAS domain S-box-containing protein
VQLEGLLQLRTADSQLVRKNAEEESRLHAAILENMPSGVLLVRESDQIIVYANQTLAQIVGYAPDELIGQHLACLSQPGVKKLLPIGNNRAWTGEQSVLAKDGNEIWCDIKLAKFSHATFGKVWIAVYTDISFGLKLEREIAEQKRMQLEVNAQLQRMESLLKSATVASTSSGPANDRCLTRRQQEILGFVAEGLTSAQISTKLNISSATVMAHRRDIMRKLDLHSTAALTRYAIQGKAVLC